MKFGVLVRAAAREDIRVARDWYNEQAAGLGGQFGDELDHAIALIGANPMMFPNVQGRVRAERSRVDSLTRSTSLLTVNASQFSAFFIRREIRASHRDDSRMNKKTSVGDAAPQRSIYSTVTSAAEARMVTARRGNFLDPSVHLN